MTELRGVQAVFVGFGEEGVVAPMLVHRPPVALQAASASIAHIRQSRPDSGLGFQVKILKNSCKSPENLSS